MAEGKRVLRDYVRGRVRMLQDAGLSGSLASKAANAEVRALDAAYDLFDTLDDVREAGRLEVAVWLWVEFYATSLLPIELLLDINVYVKALVELLVFAGALALAYRFVKPLSGEDLELLRFALPTKLARKF